MKDRNYIKNIFDNDGIKAPESLSEEEILRMLNAAEASASEVTGSELSRAEASTVHESPTEETGSGGSAAEGSAAEEPKKEADFVKAVHRKRRGIRPENRRVLAVAASVMIAIAGISGLGVLLDKAPDTSLINGELYTFRNEGEIKRTIRELDHSSPVSFLSRRSQLVEENLDYSTDAGSEVMDAETAESFEAGSTGGADNGMTVSNPADTAAPAGEAKSLSASGDSTASQTQEHSSTYLQVDNVDESDIIKTDGKYIYYVNKRQEVIILSAADGKTEKLATIGYSGVENYVEDIYLRGDRLVTVGRFYKNDSDEPCTGVVIYDISDRSHPETVSDYSQTGQILTSRMIGDHIYLVTNDYVSRGGRTVPMYGPSDAMKKLAASEISCVPEPSRSSYIVLGAVDIASGTQGRSTVKAVFGASDEIYCNDHNLYATSYEWNSEGGGENTRIVRAALDGTSVKFNATAAVRGHINNQFSMDERDGYFRIATTSQRAGIDVNNLFILDNNLKETGSVTGFARNESIKAVRFIGSKAYVITYEAIDPLFIIDLSDPAKPRIEGEVMIDGFSTLLIPLSADRLLGIGHATGDNGYGGEYDSGLKLALFDISEPSKPAVLDSKEFKDMTSPAQSDHHALTINTEAGYLAIPYEIWHYDDELIEDGAVIIEDAEEPEDTAAAADGTEAAVSEDTEAADEGSEDAFTDAEPEEISLNENGVLVFKAEDRISSVDRHSLKLGNVNRCVYIGNYIYALDSDGNVKSFKPSV